MIKKEEKVITKTDTNEDYLIKTKKSSKITKCFCSRRIDNIDKANRGELRRISQRKSVKQYFVGAEIAKLQDLRIDFLI